MVVLPTTRYIVSVCQSHRSAADTLYQVFSQLGGYQSHPARLQIHHQCLSAAEVSSVSCSRIARLQIHHPCLSAASRDCRYIIRVCPPHRATADTLYQVVLTTTWVPFPPRATADLPASVSVSRRGIAMVCQPHRATADTPSVSYSRIAQLQLHHLSLSVSRIARLQLQHLSVSCSRLARLQIHH